MAVREIDVWTSSADEEAAVAGFPSIAHVAVTVTDLDRSTRWYSELLGSEPVLDEDEASGGFESMLVRTPAS